MRHIQKKSFYMKAAEARIGEPLEEALRRKFVDENKPIQLIADETGASYEAIIKWLKLCGVYSRRLRIQ